MNRSISDLIEQFIMSSLDDDDFIELSRNDLAKFFSCVPSQINYVLNTRFTPNRGFTVESQRGGAGFIKVVRVSDTADNFLRLALEKCSEPISQIEAEQLLNNMVDKKLINARECELIKCTISQKSLNNPLNMDNMLRSNIMQQIIIKLMQKQK